MTLGQKIKDARNQLEIQARKISVDHSDLELGKSLESALKKKISGYKYIEIMDNITNTLSDLITEKGEKEEEKISQISRKEAIEAEIEDLKTRTDD